MNDRFSIQVKFEVTDGDKKAPALDTTRLQKKTKGSVKKDVKCQSDFNAARTSLSKPSDTKDQSLWNVCNTHRGREAGLIRIDSSSKTCLRKKQPINQRTATKNVPMECAADRKSIDLFDGRVGDNKTLRKPRECVSARNVRPLKPDSSHSTDWVFPLSASLDRELTLIDLDVKYSAMRKHRQKAQVPPSLIAKDKNKIDSCLESASRRPRSCNSSSSGTVRRLSFPTVACDRIHGTDWIFRAGNDAPEENSSVCRSNSGVRSSEHLRDAGSLTTASDSRGRTSGTIIPGAFFDYALFNQED